MLYIHIDFPGKKASMYLHLTFFKNLLAVIRNTKMVNLDILPSLKWQDILHSLSEVLYSRSNNNYEIEENSNNIPLSLPPLNSGTKHPTDQAQQRRFSS